MPFTLIKGTFHVTGYAPDGDSIRFQADDNANWAKLSGASVRLNGRNHAQLRFEAIDTLETHYGNKHQPLALADAATDFLLTRLGIINVLWNDDHTVITQALDGTRGYILSRATERNRRPVSFVYSGDAPEADGASIFLNANRLMLSVNHQALEQGWAYPTYYDGLFADLRNALTAAVTTARANDAPLWIADRTTLGFPVTTVNDLEDQTVILPKLFRRLVDYIGTGGDISGFKHFLELEPDPLLILTQGHFTNLDTLIEVIGNQVRLTELPENLVFIPI
ncbi:MAG: hypothetical protein U0703_12835 [Anaerolineae bacterium]